MASWSLTRGELVLRRTYRAYAPAPSCFRSDGKASLGGLTSWILQRSFRFMP